jgi:hypothetical protein
MYPAQAMIETAPSPSPISLSASPPSSSPPQAVASSDRAAPIVITRLVVVFMVVFPRVVGRWW